MSAARAHPLLELGVTIIVPSLVLMQGSDALGSAAALALALAFPVGWGLWDGLRRRSLNWLAAVGVLSTLLTGGIALLKLDAGWLAIKEGAVSALIGIVVAASAWTRRPLIHTLVFDAALLDTARIAQALAARRAAEAFETRLRQGTLLLAGTFFFSAAASYGLARWVVRSPAGTPAFNEELGRLTLLSYTLIALPSLLMLIAIVFWLGRVAQRLTGLTLSEILGGHP